MKSFVAILALVAVAAADVAHILRSPEADASIVQQDADVFPDQYQYSYGTSNGISGQEAGVLQNPGREDEGIEVQGSNSWTAPDGQVIKTVYTAGKDGYRAEGAHIPVAPPVPEYILRALAFIESRPPQPQKN
ncbi:flexible cuticle protein 12-like [Bicyclus anynana]|uniref:Flexible cuticle protein 12-like n=1 Tax=Bicyclus anynana TaxID=110368 RepID=A0A6J1NNB8_BICAN|nr:flexible cuticle protein 12-like [Bicyclus anynana]